MSLELLVISVVSVIFLFIILFLEVNMPLTVLPDDSKVIRLDNDYYVISATLYLMIRRYLVALRKGDGSAETLFHL